MALFFLVFSVTSIVQFIKKDAEIRARRASRASKHNNETDTGSGNSTGSGRRLLIDGVLDEFALNAPQVAALRALDFTDKQEVSSVLEAAITATQGIQALTDVEITSTLEEKLKLKRGDLSQLDLNQKRAMLAVVEAVAEVKEFSEVAEMLKNRDELMKAIRSYKFTVATKATPNQDDKIAWQQAKKRLLRENFPGKTEEELKKEAYDFMRRLLQDPACIPANIIDLVNVIDVSGSMGVMEKHLTAMAAVAEITRRLGPQDINVESFANYRGLNPIGPRDYEPTDPDLIAQTAYIGGGTAPSSTLNQVLQNLPLMMNNGEFASLMAMYSDFNVNSSDRDKTRAAFRDLDRLFPELIKWCIAIGADADLAMAQELCTPGRVIHYPDTDAFYNSVTAILSQIAPIICPQTATPTTTSAPATAAPSTAQPPSSVAPTLSSAAPTARPTAAPDDESNELFVFFLNFWRRRLERGPKTPEEQEQLDEYERRKAEHEAKQRKYEADLAEYHTRLDAYNAVKAKYDADLAAYNAQQTIPADPRRTRFDDRGPDGKLLDAHKEGTSRRVLTEHGVPAIHRGLIVHDADLLGGNLDEPHSAGRLPHPGREPEPPQMPVDPGDFTEPEPKFEARYVYTTSMNPLATIYGALGNNPSNAKDPQSRDRKSGFLGRLPGIPDGRPEQNMSIGGVRLFPFLIGEQDFKLQTIIEASGRAAEEWRRRQRQTTTTPAPEADRQAARGVPPVPPTGGTPPASPRRPPVIPPPPAGGRPAGAGGRPPVPPPPPRRPAPPPGLGEGVVPPGSTHSTGPAVPPPPGLGQPGGAAPTPPRSRPVAPPPGMGPPPVPGRPGRRGG
jgi:hypothetical protein